ncbi:MAG: glucosamine 6-phosphate synthetase, contains amidotransferase and phosphosugar isomerase domain, partial [Actinomycetia bacterium]|nr:glucosamine 6-phosphate synthetase, contains amidotransferase and phosphosugar isomerase domain [Actinomycetes bacterium]
AEITTRDIARGGFAHYLEKEISEAPSSFRKTLRGRTAIDGDRLHIALGESSFPAHVREKFATGAIGNVIVIGQGTAAVAAQGIATVLTGLLDMPVVAMPASELSAWKLAADMSRTCIVAISQSGTTTDTNRTVDMARGRGATVLAIVNRRDSDLVHKSEGVLYTSDGRDIEMAVASTKAFYSQVAAGLLLGLQLASATGQLAPETEETLLRALLDMPAHLEAVLAMGPEIAAAAAVAARFPSWAVVGSGPNRTAAEEIRIKLSELCYKTVSTDAVEDKKHVDLSAEAMVLVCAAGTPAGQLRDLSKEIEIFAAHKNVPIVIVDQDVDLPWATEYVLRVPRAHPSLAWLLSTAVGHLFAYHAAQAIDATAQPLRQSLTELEERVDAGPVVLSDLHSAVEPLDGFIATASTGAVRGVLSSNAALGLAASALLMHGLPGQLTMTPRGIVDPVEHVRDLMTAAIEELSRSIDSVKHQAKTVTVGTSRGDSDLLDNPLTSAFADTGGNLDMLNYASLLAVRAFSKVASGVTGGTRYQITWTEGRGQLRVTAKTGAATNLASRADSGAELTGSKDLVVQSRLVRLVRGRRDGRLVLMIPEQAGARVTALTLLHLDLAERAEAGRLVELLEMTGSRLAEIRAAVTETDRTFDTAALASVPVETLLLAPVDQVAQAITT